MALEFLEEAQGDEVSVKDAVRKLRELRFDMLNKEEEYKEAQKKYSDYAIKVLPEKFAAAGLSSMTAEDGSKLELTTQVRASVTKEGKLNVAKWLEEHQAEDLVSKTCVVPASYAQKLRENNIAFEESVEMNTTRIKSVVSEMLGLKGTPATIGLGDLPKGLSWYQWNEVVVK